MAEKKQRFPGFVGPAYTSRADRFDCQRLVNYYIEIDETGAGKGGEPAVLIGTPGLRALQTIGTGPIRAVYTLSNQPVCFVVSGNEVYQISGALSIPIQITGNLTTNTGPVSVSDNGIQVLFVDGSNGYYVEVGQTTLNTISDPNFFPANTVTFQDGYFILNKTGTPYFFYSDLYSIDFLPFNEAAKTGNSDILMAVISNNRQLYLLGASTTEIWFNSGASGSTPFQRQDGRFSQVGCAAPASIAKLSETFFWLGSNAQGGGIVYSLENAMPGRVSTHAIEYIIQQYTDLSGATGYAYQQEGHYFYALNIPGADTTLVYDMASKQWHERQSTTNGVVGRNLAGTHCVLNNQHIVGGYNNNKIYALDLDYYTDDGDMIARIRQTPHISDSLNRMFYKLMECDFQFGTGLVDNQSNPGNAVNPRAVLEISNDGGKTWGNPIYAQMGEIGRWYTRARWQRLGSSRDRVFRVTVTDPVKVQLLSCMLDVEIGMA
jgi:hypothetical protein